MQHMLVTGGAGFIGSHLIETLLNETDAQVTGVDNFDPFYDPAYKRANIAGFLHHPRFRLIEADITRFDDLQRQITGQYDVLIHLAAKAGVRTSIQFPQECYTANVLGTQNLLELSKELGIPHFVFGSSSSVYGINPNVPWRETDTDYNPISPYAASKISGEMLAHVYAHLYHIRLVILRFFTVYGPRQRPDLAIHKFTKLMYEGKPIPFYGDGSTRRDYTYVTDIVRGIIGAMHYRDSAFEIINLGNHQTVSLSEMVEQLGRITGKPVTLQRLPAQPGDVPQTYADITKAGQLLAYTPETNLSTGLEKFVDWYGQSLSEIQFGENG